MNTSQSPSPGSSPHTRSISPLFLHLRKQRCTVIIATERKMGLSFHRGEESVEGIELKQLGFPEQNERQEPDSAQVGDPGSLRSADGPSQGQNWALSQECPRSYSQLQSRVRKPKQSILCHHCSSRLEPGIGDGVGKSEQDKGEQTRPW